MAPDPALASATPRTGSTARLLSGTVLILVIAVFAGAMGVPPATLAALAVLAVLVLSLELVVGVAGILTLGQAAMFGVGGYAAGIVASLSGPGAFSGLAIGALAGGAFACITGAILLRASGLQRLILTVAFAEILAALARLAPNPRPVPRLELGGSLFSADGNLAIYAVAVLLVVFVLVTLLREAPFGLSLRALQENPVRMSALGASSFPRLWLAYGLGGTLAGLAGALHIQTTGAMSPALFSFALSVEAIVLLAIGGRGRLWGPIIGVALVLLAVALSPVADLERGLIVGALGIVVLIFCPSGLTGIPDQIRRATWTFR